MEPEGTDPWGVYIAHCLACGCVIAHVAEVAAVERGDAYVFDQLCTACLSKPLWPIDDREETTMSNDQTERANCPGCSKPIDLHGEGWVNIVPSEYANRLNEDNIPRVPWHYTCWEADRIRRKVDIGY